MTGIVRKYHPNKGWGLIEPLVGKPGQVANVFFHISAMTSKRGHAAAAPPVGAEVRFIIVRGEKGPQAASIELVRYRKGLLRASSPSVLRQQGVAQ